MKRYEHGTLNLVQGAIVPGGQLLVKMVLENLNDALIEGGVLVFSFDLDGTKIDSKNIYVDSRKSLSITSMLEECKLKRKWLTKLNMVLVDHAVLWGANTLPTPNDLSLLKQAAKDLDVCIIVMTETLPDTFAPYFDNQQMIRVSLPDLSHVELEDFGVDLDRLKEIEATALRKLRGLQN